MLQTLKAQPPPLPALHECPAQTTTTNILVNNKEACLMPNSGPVSRAYHLLPRRQPRGYKTTQQSNRITMSSPISRKQGTSGNSDAVGIGSMDKISIPKLRERHQEHEEQQSATSTPTKKASSRQTSLYGTSPVESDTSAEQSAEMEAETKTQAQAVSPTLLQQRSDHWNGLHIGRDPYGLASKEYLDAGLPPPWPRCDWCEEEMPWLQRKR